jgi:signal peptidase I
VSEPEGAGRRADSPRRRARAAAAPAVQPDGLPPCESAWFESGSSSSSYGGSPPPADSSTSGHEYQPAGYQSPDGGRGNPSSGYVAPGQGAAVYGAVSDSSPGYGGSATFEASGYPTGAVGAALRHRSDDEFSQSPYGNGAVASAPTSPYDTPVTSAGRSPYENLLGPSAPGQDTDARPPSAAPSVPATRPPVVPMPAPPPSPMNGSPIARGQGYADQGWGRSGTGRVVLPDSFPQGGASPNEDCRVLDGRRADSEPWLGASAPPQRRGSRAGRDAEAPFAVRSRAERAGSREPDGSGVLSQRLGIARRGGGAREDEPQTPFGVVTSAVTEVVVVLAMALALSLGIKTFLVQAFYIPSPSMQDTLQIGDRILVSKITPRPLGLHRGDVVVFKDPGHWLDPQPQAQLSQGAFRHALTVALTFVGLLPQDSGEHLIKRVIGLPGDKVACCDAEGRVTVNGTPVDETYVRSGNEPSNDPFSVTVKKDRIWVMGDNRGQSLDSRYHLDLDSGQVPIENVVGKAFVVVWPFSHFGGVVEPPGVFARVPDSPATGAK